MAVAITGMGALSALGRGTHVFFEALCSGRVGIRTAKEFASEEYGVHVAACVDTVGPGPRRASLLAMEAAREALGQARLDVPFAEEFAGRVAVVVGTTLGGILGLLPRLRGDNVCVPMTFTHSGPAVDLAAALGAEGPLVVPSVACASGTAAVGLGMELIRQGSADVALVGGVDALSDFVFAGFHSLGILDPDPARPFGHDRRGLTLGEGAAFLVLESEEHSAARGVSPLALVTGHGLSDDARHITGPDPEGKGAAQAMAAALVDAGRTPADVDFVNLHGTGTSFNDAMERHAMYALFGERAREVPVNSIKGVLGHTLGAAGAFEALLLALVVQSGIIPPTVSTRELDPEIDLDVVLGAPRHAEVRVALSTTSGFGGLNAALVVERRSET